MTQQRLSEIKQIFEDGDFKHFSLSKRRQILEELRTARAEQQRQAARTEIETATEYRLTGFEN